MKSRCWHLFLLAVLALMVLVPLVADAQMTPEQDLAQIISGLQSGVYNWSRFAPPIWQIIYQQTGGSGRYPGLAALGQPTSIVQTGGWPLPNGYFYMFRTDFQSGSLMWQVAADNFGRIWGIQFQPVSNPNPAEPAPKMPTGGKSKGDQPASKDDACKLYPNLC